MPMIQPPSVSTVVLDGQSFARGLELLAKVGVQVVEPAFIQGYMSFDEETFTERGGLALGRQVKDAGLAIRAMSVHMDLGHTDSAYKLLRRMDFAAAAGAGIIITNATTTDRVTEFRETIAAVETEIAARNLILALENPGHGRDALLPDGKRGAEVIRAIGNPRIRMNYDIGNAESYGARQGSAGDDLKAALPVAAHLHLKDLALVGDDWQFCPLGTGDIGYGRSLPLGSLPAGLPLGIEHPIRLWRPLRGDPVRRAKAPDEATVIAAVTSALEFLRKEI